MDNMAEHDPSRGTAVTRRFLLGGTAVALLSGCSGPARENGGPPSPSATNSSEATRATEAARATTLPSATPTAAPPTVGHAPTGLLSPAALDSVAQRYAGREPTSWGLDVEGVVLRSGTDAIALTLDACGGPGGNGVDTALLDLLRTERIPATLFLNARWIEAQPALVAELAAEELFELANHGTEHLPLSVTGRAAYGIRGTHDVAEVIDEVYANHELLLGITGTAPRFFRPGTAHLDDVAAALVRELGEIPVNFDVNGDAGASFTADQVASAVSAARPGSIIIGHMNRPDGATAEGLATALATLRDAGHRFARLGDLL